MSGIRAWNKLRKWNELKRVSHFLLSFYFCVCTIPSSNIIKVKKLMTFLALKRKEPDLHAYQRAACDSIKLGSKAMQKPSPPRQLAKKQQPFRQIIVLISSSVFCARKPAILSLFSALSVKCNMASCFLWELLKVRWWTMISLWFTEKCHCHQHSIDRKIPWRRP